MSPESPLSLELAGRTALVTGGTRGIGAAVARELARRGARLVLGYRADAASARSLSDEFVAGGLPAPVLVAANLVHPESARRLVEEASREGPLDFLVHSAALGAFKPLLEVKPNQWDLSLSINARAFLTLAQEAAPRMEPGSRLVALSSLGAGRAIPEYGALGASKAALESLVRSLAAELGPRGILVNAVSAGLVDGDALRAHPRWPDLRRHAEAASPLGRIAAPEDVARVVVFLLGPLSAWITGQTIVADGGASLRL